jgi:hypothetical protein
VRSRHHQVGGQHQFEPAAQGQPVDRGDDRLAEVEELGQPRESARPVVGVDTLP